MSTFNTGDFGKLELNELELDTLKDWEGKPFKAVPEQPGKVKRLGKFFGKHKGRVGLAIGGTALVGAGIGVFKKKKKSQS